MNLRPLLSGIIAAGLVALPIAQPGMLPFGATAVQAQEANVSINIFFDALGQDGTWVEHPRDRYVWVPSDVSADWRPYTNGHWAYTDRYGWTFVSNERFAWAVYHYGRWGFDPDIGWFWVPGTVWAPAWVSWRRSHEVVGWAPLPPEDEGYAVNADVAPIDPPRDYWHFVPVHDFLAPDLVVVVIHDESPFDQTELVGPVIVRDDIVVDDMIEPDFIRQAGGLDVRSTEVQVVRDPTLALGAAVAGGAIVAVASRLAPPRANVRPPRVVAAREVKAPTAVQKIPPTTVARQGQGNLAKGLPEAGKTPVVTGQGQAGKGAAATTAQEKLKQQTTGAGAAKAGKAVAGQSAVQGQAQTEKSATAKPGQKLKPQAAGAAGQAAAGGTAKAGKAPAIAGQPGQTLQGKAGKGATAKAGQKELKQQIAGAPKAGKGAAVKLAPTKLKPVQQGVNPAAQAMRQRPPKPRMTAQTAQQHTASVKQTGAQGRLPVVNRKASPKPGPKKPKVVCTPQLHAAGKC